MTAVDPAYSRRRLILAVVGVAQVMVLLDATVVNIALPSAQRGLHSSNGDRQWFVTAYPLAFGSLLPRGGRIGDLFGRKLKFPTGLIGFAASSAVRGLAQSFGWLVAARAAQGVPNERRADHRAAPDTAFGRRASAVPLRPFSRTVMRDHLPVDDPDPMVAQLPRSALIIFGG